MPEKNKLKLYDPGNYLLMGFFFSLIPVFIMSFWNSKVLPNGNVLRKRMTIYIWIYIILILSGVVIHLWALYTLYAGVLNSPDTAQIIMNAQLDGSSVENLPEFKFAKSVVSNANGILFVTHIILLIVVLKFTNNNEKTQFIAMRKEKKVDRKPAFLPGLIGLAILIFGYFYYTPSLDYLAKMLAT